MERYNEALEKMKPVDLSKVSNDEKLVRSQHRVTCCPGRSIINSLRPLDMYSVRTAVV